MSSFITNALLSSGYAAVFLFMALAAMCIPLGSEIVMLFGGALASESFLQSIGSTDKPLNFVLVAAVGVLGELVGSTIAWAVGYKGERELAERYGRFVLLRKDHLDRAERWFNEHGRGTVFFGRLIPGIRSFISLAAGFAQMPYPPFVLFTAAGSALWCLLLAGIGYAAGAEWKKIADFIQPIGYAVLALAVVAATWWVVRTVGRRRRDRVELP